MAWRNRRSIRRSGSWMRRDGERGKTHGRRNEKQGTEENEGKGLGKTRRRDQYEWKAEWETVRRMMTGRGESE